MSAATPGLRVIIIGGGIIGLACADELVRAGHDVRLFDPAPGSGATYAAAGMLAPGGEAWFGEEALLRLGVDSLRRWPLYAATLEERSGHHVDLREASSERLALAMHALGPAVVLIGGDPRTGTCRDVVVRTGVTTLIEHPTVATANDHGTGCTYSAALAVHLARGLDLETAARRAKAVVARALATSATWQLGHGRGPLAHVFTHPHEEN